LALFKSRMTSVSTSSSVACCMFRRAATENEKKCNVSCKKKNYSDSET